MEWKNSCTDIIPVPVSAVSCPGALEGSKGPAKKGLFVSGDFESLNHRGLRFLGLSKGPAKKGLFVAGDFESLNHRGLPVPEALEGTCEKGTYSLW